MVPVYQPEPAHRSRGMLIEQLTKSWSIRPALPGGHAKWVQCPCGAATVSRECISSSPPSPYRATAGKPLSADALGKAGDAATTCKPGYLTPGMSFSTAREHAGRSP